MAKLYCSTGIIAAIWVKSQTRRQCECTLFCVLRPTVVIGRPCSAVQPVVLKCSSLVNVILTVAWIHQFHSIDYDFRSYLISTFIHTFLLWEKLFCSYEKMFIPQINCLFLGEKFSLCRKCLFLGEKAFSSEKIFIFLGECLFLGENICSSEKTCIPLRRFKKKLS